MHKSQKILDKYPAQNGMTRDTTACYPKEYKQTYEQIRSQDKNWNINRLNQNTM